MAPAMFIAAADNESIGYFLISTPASRLSVVNIRRILTQSRQSGFFALTFHVPQKISTPFTVLNSASLGHP